MLRHALRKPAKELDLQAAQHWLADAQKAPLDQATGSPLSVQAVDMQPMQSGLELLSRTRAIWRRPMKGQPEVMGWVHVKCHLHTHEIRRRQSSAVSARYTHAPITPNHWQRTVCAMAICH